PKPTTFQFYSALSTQHSALLFYTDVQRGDAERQRIPTDIGESVMAQPFGERLAIGKFEHTGRQVAIGIFFAPRDELSDRRQDPAEIEPIQATEEPVPRLREFQDCHPTARPRHPGHFREAALGVGDIT